MRDFDKVFMPSVWDDEPPSGIRHTPESSLSPRIAARKARQAEWLAAEKAADMRRQAESQDPDDLAECG
jgi:hypothetical protein